MQDDGEPSEAAGPDGMLLSVRSYGEPGWQGSLVVHGLNQSRMSGGGDDLLVHPSAMTKPVLAQNRRARMSLHSGIGHSPMWEATERFNVELARFVSGEGAG